MLNTIISLSESISKIKFDEAFTNAIADQLGGNVDMDAEGNVYLNRKEKTPILIIAPFFTYPISVEKVYPDSAIGIELYDAPSHFPLPGSDVLIHGQKVYKGIIGSVPPHLQKGYQSGSAYALSDLKCDVCKDFEELQKTVFPGTRITYNFKPFNMIGGKMVGKNLDLTAPAAALLKCADELDKDLFTVCFCNNYHFALDFMMADGWANPMTQPTPKSLRDMTHEERVVAWGEYVSNVIKTLSDAGVAPEIVQVGNEISNGAFWPDGRVYYGEEKKDQSRWAEFTDYLKAGADAIKAVDEKIQVMLHVDFGGDMPMSEVFFQKMDEYGVQYDAIGVSFYPWSHGNLMDLRDNLYYTIKKWQKPMYVIETGYYSVPSQYFERKGVKAPFPETPEGQKEWFQAVNEIVMQAPDNLGKGVFWWEPMFRGRGFFDDKTKVAKPIVEAFHQYAYPMERGDGNPRIWDFEEGERP
jgi:arabinogalactan endo-1,4-beta-galactosidase